MDWREDILLLVEGNILDCVKDGKIVHEELYGEDADALGANGSAGLLDRINDVVVSAIKAGFVRGHAEGAKAAIAQLPEEQQGVYEFDPEIDRFWADRAWKECSNEIA